MNKYQVYVKKPKVMGIVNVTSIYALDANQADCLAKGMFGETAWAEEVDIVPTPT